MEALSEHGSIADVCNPGKMGYRATSVANSFLISQLERMIFSSPTIIQLIRTPEVGPCASQFGWCQKQDLLFTLYLDRLRLILKNSFNNNNNIHLKFDKMSFP